MPFFTGGVQVPATVSPVTDRDASPATRPVTAGQRGRALWFSLALGLGTFFLLPVAGVAWPQVPAFIPSYQTAVILCHGIAAFLVFSHFLGSRCPALLWLGCGCLYTAFILVAQFLSFPGMFAPGGLLPGGAQTTIWLWAMWHVGPVVGILLYAVSEWRRPGQRVADPWRAALRGVILLVLFLAVSLAAVTVFHDRLPVLDVDGDFSRITRSGVGPAIEVVTAVALLLLWRVTGFRTVLSVWIAVSLVALLCDNAVTMAGGTRLSVGWYLGRLCALVSSAVLLFGYLLEINRVYLWTAAHAEQLREQVIDRSAKLDRARLDHLTQLPARALFLELADAYRSAMPSSGFAAHAGKRAMNRPHVARPSAPGTDLRPRPDGKGPVHGAFGTDNPGLPPAEQACPALVRPDGGDR